MMLEILSSRRDINQALGGLFAEDCCFFFPPLGFLVVSVNFAICAVLCVRKLHDRETNILGCFFRINLFWNPDCAYSCWNILTILKLILCRELKEWSASRVVCIGCY